MKSALIVLALLTAPALAWAQEEYDSYPEQMEQGIDRWMDEGPRTGDNMPNRYEDDDTTNDDAFYDEEQPHDDEEDQHDHDYEDEGAE